jgi:IS5 family transposase
VHLVDELLVAHRLHDGEQPAIRTRGRRGWPQEQAAFDDAGYQRVLKRPEAEGPTWHVAMRPGLRRKLNPFIAADFRAECIEQIKASIRAKVEHPFRVLKRQFGFTKLRYRGLAKNTAQIVSLFALSNLWMARRP